MLLTAYAPTLSRAWSHVGPRAQAFMPETRLCFSASPSKAKSKRRMSCDDASPAEQRVCTFEVAKKCSFGGSCSSPENSLAKEAIYAHASAQAWPLKPRCPPQRRVRWRWVQPGPPRTFALWKCVEGLARAMVVTRAFLRVLEV